MKVTRVIAVSVMLASLGLGALNAQTLRNSSPPAEFPPASYKGKQYVDSRGCIYIRAGIDGNVSWIPRVSRERKQICGYKPTQIAGAGTTAKPAPSQQPTVITVAPTQTPAPQQAAKPATAPKPAPKPAPVVVTAAPAPKPKPRTVAVAPTTRTTTTRPATVTYQKPKPTVAAPPRQAAPVVAPRPASTQGGCSNASAFSQKYINKTGVRCGPQTEAPITYGQGWQKQSAVDASSYPITTRVVPRHVYENRQNTRNVAVPTGYKPVWKDDRLNPYRAERTLAPSVVTAQVKVPPGYQMVERNDDRMNPMRGMVTAAGNAQSDAIWSQKLPRTLNPVPTDRPVLIVSKETARSSAEAQEPLYLRLSTRSVPGAAAPAGVGSGNAASQTASVSAAHQR